MIDMPYGSTLRSTDMKNHYYGQAGHPSDRFNKPHKFKNPNYHPRQDLLVLQCGEISHIAKKKDARQLCHSKSTQRPFLRKTYWLGHSYPPGVLSKYFW